MCAYQSHGLAMADPESHKVHENRRNAIFEALRAGRTPKQIVEFFDYPRATVYRAAAEYAEIEQLEGSSTTTTRKKRHRESTKRTPELIHAVRESRLMDPSVSINELAARFCVARSTMQRIVHEDLR